jgi:hypothetical protein
MLFDEVGDKVFLEVLVKDAVRLDHENGSLYTETAGACLDDLNVIFEFASLQLGFEGVLYL